MSIRLATALTLAATSLQAEPLRIVADTAPIQSMVQAVVGDLAEVEVLLPAGASPHDYAMRPSDAIALEHADVVVWVGHGLTPFLEDPIETLAKDATVVELLDTDGWLPIELDHHDDHSEHDEHDHGAVDPHAWLAPDVQSAWIMTLANTLGQLDPANAATYQFNAATQSDHRYPIRC
ncbi:MAG: zinc ABC transporter substrate-binding protein [Marivivens sp.]|nr:zinc ABC transporter substrate-binding protein [Marivivens sp.]